MNIFVKLIDGKTITLTLNENDNLDNLKKNFIKKSGIPEKYIDKIRFKKSNGQYINNKLTLGEQISNDANLNIDINRLTLGNEEKPMYNDEYFDINDFILDSTDINDIVYFCWGNFISNESLIIMESKNVKQEYKNWHNVFRQQLPLPLLEYAVQRNRNLNMFSVDRGFHDIRYFDIRNILQKYVEPILIGNIELYQINTCDILNEIGIECPYTDSISNIYFFKYMYGFCNSHNKVATDIPICLNELEDKLRNEGIEYYIFGTPMDSETIISNNNIIKRNIQNWFDNDRRIRGGSKIMKGGDINPGRVITGDNAAEYAGRIVRIIDTQGYSDRNRWQIKELTNRRWIQDFDFNEESYRLGLKFGILLPPINDDNIELKRYIRNHILPELEPFETYVRIKYNNHANHIFYFAVPKKFQDILDHGTFPYYVELANVGKPKYDVVDEVVGDYGRYTHEPKGIFDAYQIKKKLTKKKKLREAQQRLSASQISDMDNELLLNMNEKLSTMPSDPQLPIRMIKERMENNKWGDLANFYDQYGGSKKTKKKKRKKGGMFRNRIITDDNIVNVIEIGQLFINAVIRRNYNLLDRLLEYNYDINSTNINGMNALLASIVITKDINMIRYLINKGADPNINYMGTPIINYLIINDNIDTYSSKKIIDILMEKGIEADYNYPPIDRPNRNVRRLTREEIDYLMENKERILLNKQKKLQFAKLESLRLNLTGKEMPESGNYSMMSRVFDEKEDNERDELYRNELIGEWADFYDNY